MIELIFDIFNQTIFVRHIIWTHRDGFTNFEDKDFWSVFFSIEWIRLWSYIIPRPPLVLN